MNFIQPKGFGPTKGRGRGRGRRRLGDLNANIRSSTNILSKRAALLPPRYQPLKAIANAATSIPSPSISRSPATKYGTTSSSKKSIGPSKSSSSKSPRSSGKCSSIDDGESTIIIAITCGRGEARCEVGLAAMDISYPHMIVCQMSDYHSYVNTLTKIHTLNPVEIIMPDTICDIGHNLHSLISNRFPDITITGIQRTHFNDVLGLEKVRTLCAKVYSSVELIVRQKYYALAAAAALMKYIEYIQFIQYQPNSIRIEYEESDNNTIIDIESARSLELVMAHGPLSNYCLFGALDRCSTPMGRRRLRASILQPPCDKSFIEARQACVTELVSNRRFMEMIQPIVRRLSGASRLLGLAMQPAQSATIPRAQRNLNLILLLKHTIDIIPEFQEILKTADSPFFKKVLSDLEDESFDKIKEKILTVINEEATSVVGYTSSNMQRCFAVKAGISDMLDVVRRTYCELIDDMKNAVNELGVKYKLPLSLACNSVWGYHIQMELGKRKFDLNTLPEEFINPKKGRKMIQMTTEYLLILDNHCKDATEELHMMSNVFLKEILDFVHEYIGCLFQFNDNVSELDLILSLAQVSSITDYVKPTFGPSLELRQSKHPVMDILSTERPTPNDVVASVPYNFHTITGPNMSGKTIYLKQIILLQIMAQLGCYIPATTAKVRIADRIFSKIGLRDDVEYKSSSFQLEIDEAQYILQSVTPCSLIVMDELCKSTTVEEGASIAWAICEDLANTTAFVFNATHFMQLLKMPYLFPNITNHYLETIVNECNDNDSAGLIYTHQLKKGIAVIELYGLALARSTGLPEDVLKKSKVLALDISKNLKTGVDNPDAEDSEKTTQRKKNYEALAAMYEEFENVEVDTGRISKLMKNIKLIEADKAAISDPEYTDSDATPIKSIMGKGSNRKIHNTVPTSTSSSKTDGEFKKPNPVNTPDTLKNYGPLTQRTIGRKTSQSSSSSEPERKLPKITSEEGKRILRNPLTDPNSPLFISPAEYNSISNSPRKNVTYQPYSFQKQSLNFSNIPSNLKASETFSPASKKNIAFTSTSEISMQSKYNKTHEYLTSPQSSTLEQYTKLQKAIQNMKKVNLSQENEDNIEITSETYDSESEALRDQNFQSPSKQMFLSKTAEQKSNVLRDNIPQEYLHMRHVLKNVTSKITDQNSGYNIYANVFKNNTDYFFISEPASRKEILSDDRNMPNDVKNSQIDPTISNLSNLSSVHHLSPAASYDSMNTSVAQITARQKEAEIFKIIEGSAYDEDNILGSPTISDIVTLNSNLSSNYGDES